MRKKLHNIIRAHCSGENITQKYQLSGVPAVGTPIKWPTDSQKYGLYINEELVFSSQQLLPWACSKHCCNVMFPHIWQQLMDKMKKEHKQAIHEKKAALALINDELQAIQYDNVGLQGEIKAKDKTIKDLIDNRHVPRWGEYDNILIVSQKNKPVEDDIQKSRHAFYMMRCQKKRKDTLLS